MRAAGEGEGGSCFERRSRHNERRHDVGGTRIRFPLAADGSRLSRRGIRQQRSREGSRFFFLENLYTYVQIFIKRQVEKGLNSPSHTLSP